MREVSDHWKRSVAGVNRWTSKIEYSNNGGQTWDRVDLVSGTVTADSTSQIRWHCELTVADAPFGRNGINPFTTQLRIRHGIAWSPRENDHELLGLGVYKIMTVNRDRNTPGVLSITGDSFERYLINARYRGPWKAPKQHADARLAQMITAVLPSATIHWEDAIQSRVLPAVLVERDRWEMIDGSPDAGSIAKALGAKVYCNGDGVFVVGAVRSLEDEPSWQAVIGPGGMLVNSTEELTNEYVYNAVSVSGESTESDTPAVGPYAVVDNDPHSMTYYWQPVDQGGFGSKPFFYSSQLITNKSQALQAGRARLATLLGLRQQVAFDSLHDPAKEPGDVGLVTNADGTTEKVILDSVTYDLGAAPLTCSTRSTQTRLAGEPVEATEVEES